MIRILLCALFAAFLSTPASAKGIPFWIERETSQLVLDLPDTDQYNFDGDQVDIGILYTGYELLFIPLWQTNIRYVGTIEGDDSSYYELTENQINELVKSADMTLPPLSDVKLGFWTAWGGKLIILSLVLLAVFGLFLKDGDDEEEEEEETEADK